MSAELDPIRGGGRAFGREFFERDPVIVAPKLLGCFVSAGGVTLRLTEVEAYRQDDPASHSYRGRTRRNEVMFGPAGHLYVYFTYGMHFCANITCGADGFGAAVLLRAGEIITGADAARVRRGPRPAPRDLARGPARLASAMGWSRDDDGSDMIGSIQYGEAGAVEAGPRTGISKAADVSWRFWIPGDQFVSPYRRHPRAN